ncbi:saposin A [Thecamonas trahens ATCC 50062]|uniref:Saposin A n=1 Tax=Thecamonas trahens ATCC 50062 TaxID=461836 RepID=A0A0L0DE92_THETB|nr:saposin A [Thecamonas trahens ATCC 50062]KNC50604.1 saposin A [Thecamonas trahens ATCC 50062]|eukprot:XP_013762491.1 saposin A [Thecamonas trahens ATCC 50062]
MKSFIVLAVVAAILASAVATPVRVAQPESEIPCAICKLVVDYVDHLLASNSTVAAIEAELEKLCSDLPKAWAGECTDVVENYLPAIIQAIENNADPTTVCTQNLHLCSSSMKVQAPFDDCSICELVVGELEKLLENNHTIEIIETELGKVCALLPASWASTCTALVNNYLPELIQHLEDDLPPQTACQKIGFCKPSATPVKIVIDDVQSFGGVECSLCELLFKAVEGYLAKNNTEAQIEAELEKLCAHTPWKDSCDSIVEEYLPQIIEAIESNETPEQLCTTIGLCSSEIADVAAPFDDCSICQLVVGELEKLLENNHTIEIIETELGKVCALLPASWASTCTALVNNYLPELIQHLEDDLPPKTACQRSASASRQIEAELEKLCAHTPWKDSCDSIVEEYLPQIIEAIESNETPEQLCTTIGLCSSEIADVAAPFDDCSICQLVVGELEKLLENNHTIEIIETELGKVCALLPASWASTCTALVNNYLPELIQHLEDDLPPKTACQKIGFCKPSAAVDVAAPLDLECSLCELVAKAVEGYLAKNNTQAQIVAELEKLCAMTPWKDSCDSIVEEYLPQIIQAIEDNETPEQLCTTIGLCSSAIANIEASPETCKICEYVVSLAEAMLSGKSVNNTQIEDELKKACVLLPKKFQPECSLLVDTALPAILDELEKGTPAAQVCTTLHLCTSSDARPHFRRAMRKAVHKLRIE